MHCSSYTVLDSGTASCLALLALSWTSPPDCSLLTRLLVLSCSLGERIKAAVPGTKEHAAKKEAEAERVA